MRGLDRKAQSRYLNAFAGYYRELKVEPDQSGYEEGRTINQRLPGAQWGATYRKDVLGSDEWKATSACHLSRYPTCWVCQSRFRLAPHHMTYERVTQEQEGDLVTLCQLHHCRVHVLSKTAEYKPRSYAWILAKMKSDRLDRPHAG